MHLLRRPPQWPAYHASVSDAARAPPTNELVAGAAALEHLRRAVGICRHTSGKHERHSPAMSSKSACSASLGAVSLRCSHGRLLGTPR